VPHQVKPASLGDSKNLDDLEKPAWMNYDSSTPLVPFWKSLGSFNSSPSTWNNFAPQVDAMLLEKDPGKLLQ